MKSKNTLSILILVLIIYSLGCSKKADNPTPAPPTAKLPEISSILPTKAGVGEPVTISGVSLNGATAVSFGGVAASSFSVVSATSIIAIVGTGASGEVKVTTASGSASKAGFEFTVPNPLSPTIANVNQTTGTIGSLITITGTNFTGTTGVTFGGTAVEEFTVLSNTSILGLLATGASGEVKVTTPNGTASLAGFNYAASPVSAGKLADLTNNAAVHIGFPLNGFRQKTTGTVKVAVIFVDFSDNIAAKTPQEVFGIISPGSENFLNSVSHGKIAIAFEPSFKWHRMSKPSSAYSWNALTFKLHQDYIQEAVNLADADINFANTDEILVVANPYGGSITNGPTFVGWNTQGSTGGIVADGKTIGNAVTSGRDLLVFKELWFPHEFGHSMGLPDLYPYTGNVGMFVGGFSLMGNILGYAPDYAAWEKWILGWFTDDQVRAVTIKGSGLIKLTPLEVKGGMKLLVLPINGSSALIVEDRRAIGYDKNITKDGPVVYLVDTKTDSGQGPLKVLPINNNDNVKSQLPLSVGQTLTYGNIAIKCTASGVNGSTIEYEIK